MKSIKYLFAAALITLSGSAIAQECDVPVAVVIDPGFTQVTEETASVLQTQMERLAAQSNMNIGWESADFALTAKFDQMDKFVTNTAPAQIVNSYTVTLMIVDMYQQKSFATTAIDVKGIGTNETKASLDAVKHLNAQNAKISAFMKSAKQKIINYYDSQITTIIKKAETKAAMKQYDEALASLMVVPTCCNCYNKAMSVALKLYKQNLNYYSQKLLNTAKAMWAANPTAAGSEEVAAILSTIDPDAKCYNQAMTMLSEVKKTSRSDIDFENKKKYSDSVELQKLQIKAMGEIGKAYASNRPKNVITVIGGGKY